VLLELENKYVEEIKKRSVDWLGEKATEINWINTDKPITSFQKRLL